MERKLVVHPEKCMSCHTCELACATAHSEAQELLGAIREDLLGERRIILTRVDGRTVPEVCRHCADAPCIKACQPHAIYRSSPDSPVCLDLTKCNDCNACIPACPFGVIQRTRGTKRITKCDLCAHRLVKGKEPACVEACPTYAIEYLTLSEAKARPGGTPRDLITYTVKAEQCSKCGACFRKCPNGAIIWEKKAIAEIVQEKCIKCGLCFTACKFDAIEKAAR